MIITMPIDIITSPMYKKTIKAAKFVAKFGALDSKKSEAAKSQTIIKEILSLPINFSPIVKA